jgi:fucose 4-O-acetylase-like acetyltransferase
MEQTKRLDYIDALKGFAILLVVMGHFLANCHTDFKTALVGGGQSMLLWKFIYSFHMPLFMFCSGLVFKFDNPSLSNLIISINKRIKGLMLPYFGMGAVAFFLLDKFAPFWYLYTLFVFYVITLAIYLIMSRFQWWHGIAGSVILLITGLFVQISCSKLGNYEIKPFLDIGHFSLYFFFCLGVVFKKHQISKYCGTKFFSTTVIIFFILFLIKFDIIHTSNNHLLSVVTSRMYVLSAILMLYSLFLNVEKGYTFTWLKKIGFISLEIYILHPFFLPKLAFFEDAFNSFAPQSSVIIQFFVSLVASILLIVCCSFFAKIPPSPLKKILFGK